MFSFSKSYAETREKFVESANAAGASLASIQHPLKGPEGESLLIDFAAVGTAGVKNGLGIASVTHGAEGLCGSGCQTEFLSNLNMLKNYTDFSAALNMNDGCRDIQEILLPDQYDNQLKQNLDSWIEKHGHTKFVVTALSWQRIDPLST
jgi:hypothetical protein